MLGHFDIGMRDDGNILPYIKEVRTTLKNAYDVIRDNLDFGCCTEEKEIKN